MPNQNKGHLRLRKDSYDLSLQVVTYEEEGKKIAYSPALELAGSGSNDQTAIKDLLEIVAITFDYARTKGTLEEMLFDLGWRKISEKSIEAPTFSDEELTKKLNVHHITRYDEELAIPA